MSKKMLLAAAGLIFGLQSMSVMAASISAATEAIQKQDYATAIDDLKDLIEEGNSDATNLMGQLYENGWGVKQDIAKARSLYDQGARQGNINSVNSLRKLKNIEYKVELDALLPKVKAGDASAQNRAGEMYEFGYGTDRDGAMAFNLYQLAAKQDFVAAQHNLGRSYNFGTGTEQNFEEAERWYRTAAKQGYTNSMFFLGEYASMIGLSAIAATLYLGGYNVPGVTGNLANLLGPGVMIFKIAILVFVIIWIRWTWPRLREDQLQTLAWHWLIPLALANIVIVAIFKVAF